MKHQKHTDLIRPGYGEWGRNEWSILGGKCSDIKELARIILNQLSELPSLYIDADHKSDDYQKELDFDTMTDKIGSLLWHKKESVNKFVHRPQLAHYNLILVNGNHFQAKRQIVILDRDKEASLKKRIDQLSHVDLVLLHDNMRGERFEFFDQYLMNLESKPIFYSLNDAGKVAAYINSNIEEPPLKALVLVGGKSQRMGHDKALIEYNGQPQFEYVYNLLSEKIKDVFISCNSNQVEKYKEYNIITDTFHDLGPLGGILSAFRSDPNAAWLVVACDLPMVNQDTIHQLIASRDPMFAGTAFKSTHSEWMEPLISIYEPAIYPTALGLLAQGYSCARKVMINAPVKVVHAKNVDWLINVNTPEDKLAITSK